MFKKVTSFILITSLLSASAFAQTPLATRSDLDNEIQTREAVVSSLEKQIRDYEGESRGRAGSMVAAETFLAFFLFLGAPAEKPAIRLVQNIVATLTLTQAIYNGAKLTIAVRDLPELKARLEEEKAYTELLKHRRDHPIGVSQ